MYKIWSHYRQAPEEYVGNKLVSYGQSIKLSTSWHRGRGDTAGYFTKSPDVILEVKICLISKKFKRNLDFFRQGFLFERLNLMILVVFLVSGLRNGDRVRLQKLPRRG